MKPRSPTVALVVVTVVVACATAVAPPGQDPAVSILDDGGAPSASDALVLAVPDGEAPDAPSVDAAVDDAADGSKPALDAMTEAASDAAVAAEAGADASFPDAADASAVKDAAACATFTGTLVTFDFKGEPGNQLSSAPVSSAKGLFASAITRGPALKATSGANAIAASGWPSSSSVGAGAYFTFTLTPDPACALDVATLTLDGKIVGLGPVSGAVATSADGFVVLSKLAPGVASTVTVGTKSVVGPVEVRIYGYAAPDPTAVWRVQNALTVTGALK